MATTEEIGNKILAVVFSVLVIVVALALATNLSPTVIQYLTDLGNQMKNDSSTITQTLGTIVLDFGSVIWYGSIIGGAFASIYAVGKKMFE